MQSKQSGFTLLEVMVTLVIVGILASIALPSMSNLLEDDRAEGFTLELKRNFMYARAQATVNDESVVVCPLASVTDTLASTAANTACVNSWDSENIGIFVDRNSDLIFNHPDDIMLRTMDVITDNNANDLFIHSVGSVAVSFDGQGRIPDGQLGDLTFCPNGDNAQSITLNLSASGRVRNTGHNDLITCT